MFWLLLKKVIDACKKFLPSMAVGFDDPKVDLLVGDGFAFVEKHDNEFDIIITDSSDPIGDHRYALPIHIKTLLTKLSFTRMRRPI